MLFAEKKNALNFIKFNYDEIYKETGKAPSRAYYCKACGGWHVTSKQLPVSNRKKTHEMISIARQHLQNGKFHYCLRFLVYADSFFQKIVIRNKEIDPDADINNQISSLKNKVYHNFMNLLRTPSTKISSSSLTFEPFLMHKLESNFVYAVNNGNLQEEDLELIKVEKGEELRNLFLYRLHIIDVIKDADSSAFKTNYYEQVEDMFEGKIYGYWIQGRKLCVLLNGSKKVNSKFLSPKHLTYWIKMGNRTVRFFAGIKNRYTCLFTENEIKIEDRILPLIEQIKKEGKRA